MLELLTRKHLSKRCEHLEGRVSELLIARDRLEDHVHTLDGQYKKLQLTKKIEEEEIAHKLKMREGEIDLKYGQKSQEIQKVADENVGKVKDEYRDKIEKNLEKRGDELKTMYTEILARLPEVSVNVGGTKVKTKSK